LAVLVAVQLFAVGLYLPPVFKSPAFNGSNPVLAVQQTNQFIHYAVPCVRRSNTATQCCSASSTK